MRAVDEIEQVDYGLLRARKTVRAVEGGFGPLGNEGVFHEHEFPQVQEVVVFRLRVNEHIVFGLQNVRDIPAGLIEPRYQALFIHETFVVLTSTVFAQLLEVLEILLNLLFVNF